VVGESFQLSSDEGNIVSLSGIDADSGLVLVRPTFEGETTPSCFSTMTMTAAPMCLTPDSG